MRPADKVEVAERDPPKPPAFHPLPSARRVGKSAPAEHAAEEERARRHLRADREPEEEEPAQEGVRREEEDRARRDPDEGDLRGCLGDPARGGVGKGRGQRMDQGAGGGGERAERREQGGGRGAPE